VPLGAIVSLVLAADLRDAHVVDHLRQQHEVVVGLHDLEIVVVQVLPQRRTRIADDQQASRRPRSSGLSNPVPSRLGAAARSALPSAVIAGTLPSTGNTMKDERSSH